MSANTLDTAKYNAAAANTVNDAVLDAAALLAWRQNVKAVVDQHATEIDGKLALSGGTMSGGLVNTAFFVASATSGVTPNKYLRSSGGSLQILSSDFSRVIMNLDDNGYLTSTNIKRGAGSPEGVFTGSVGDIFLRTDGGASTTFYVKQSGTGNTGWVAK